MSTLSGESGAGHAAAGERAGGLDRVAHGARAPGAGPRTSARAPRISSAGWVARSTRAAASSSRVVRLGPGDPGRARVGRRGVGLGVEEDRGYVDPGDPVDQAVMGLADDREAVVLEPATSHSSHSGLVRSRLLGEGAGGEVAQLLLAAGGGEGGVADVVVEVQVGVVDPDRAALVEGDEAELLAEARDQVQPRLQVGAELVVGRRRAVEDHRRGDVHVGAVALEVQEGGVEAGEAVQIHRTHSFTS